MTNRLILRTATKPLSAVILLFAAFLLLRGHNEPGGGFIAGLVAGSAFALHLLARGVEAARNAVPIPPLTIVAGGLLMALLAGVMGLLHGGGFLTGQWSHTSIPSIGVIGTPLLFDSGVFLVVAGMTMAILLTLAEEES